MSLLLAVQSQQAQPTLPEEYWLLLSQQAGCPSLPCASTDEEFAPGAWREDDLSERVVLARPADLSIQSWLLQLRLLSLEQDEVSPPPQSVEDELSGLIAKPVELLDVRAYLLQVMLATLEQDVAVSQPL